MSKTHTPETRKDTGPARPRTVCGREMLGGGLTLAPFGTKPTCKSCQKRQGITPV